MAESYVDSIIEIPIVPAFFHLSLVKVAVPLFYKYGSDVLNTAMTDIQLQYLPASFNVSVREKRTMKNNRAREALLFIPEHLRRRVLEAVNGIECEFARWRMHHRFLRFENENSKCIEDLVNWRSDGTIDRIKTAQELVSNKNISIERRFEIACEYCLKERIKTLWAEMVASGKADNYETTDDSLENNWIEWIRGGTIADWTQVVIRQYHRLPRPRYNSFFSSLQPEDRKKALCYLIEYRHLDSDDLRFCLYAMTNKEKEKVVKMDVKGLLFLFAKWPLQHLFLEVAERVKNYIDFDSFFSILRFIKFRTFTGDFEYGKMILGFLKINPDHYKKLLEEYESWSDDFHECIEEDRFPKIRYVGPRKKLRRFYP